jgi:hypothetical protein
MIPTISRRAFLAAASTLPWVSRASADGPLQYYSDYLSFVGSDDGGSVYFALDTNRGRDGDDYVADHFVAAFVDGKGFLELHGHGRFDNTEKRMRQIPSSYYYRFDGTPETGLTMTSPINDLSIAVEPLKRTLLLEPGDGFFWVGGAAARMTYGGRTLTGRVIYEALFFDNWNRFARKYDDMWRNFIGLYLRTDTDRDFYLHSQESPSMAKRVGGLEGLATWDTPAPVSSIEFIVTATEPPAEGGFLWPVAWVAQFDHGGRRYRLEAAAVEKDPLWTWGTGGFMMATVAGEIRSLDGVERMTVSGWGELLI